MAGGVLTMLVMHPTVLQARIEYGESQYELVEEALRESEERYQMLLDGIEDYAIFMMDPLGRIVSWNAGAERIKGYRAAEIIGKNFSCFFPADEIEQDRPREVLRMAAENGRHEEQGMRVRKDGSRFLASVTVSALRNPSGNLMGFSEFSRDLSEVADHRRTEEKYRALFNSMDEGYCTIEVLFDEDGKPIDFRFLEINPAFEKQIGIQNAIGKTMREIAPLHEQHWFDLFGGIALTGEPARFEQVAAELQRCFDGYAFRVGEPHQRRVVILFSDVTERRRSGELLAQNEKRYRMLLEAAPDAMVVVNAAGKIIFLNAQTEKHFGYVRDELAGRPLTNIIPSGFAERLIADGLRSAEEALAQQIGTGIELTGRRKDGSEFPIEIMLSPVESDEGLLVTVAIRDVTALRRKANADLRKKVAELDRSNQELAEFAYIASHDLQEPLRMVASYTQLLSRRYKGKLDADADEFIAFAVDGANRMQRLIQDLLAYSQVGTKGADLIDSSSEAALKRALENLCGAIESAGAVVTHDVLPTVLADESQLIQLFQNLVGNGIKYQSHGVPRVHVSAARTADARWLFSVRDNGLGINPLYFGKIFGMFQRLHKREAFAGTGIGLPICKKIVERHGGNIAVESQLGHGSTFLFSLAGSETDSRLPAKEKTCP
jgi:PAS domain S-box-containing protein